MILTRIKRGATRAHILVNTKFNQFRLHQPKIRWRSIEKAFLSFLAVQTVLLPLSLLVPATAMAASSDESGPVPRLTRISPETVDALALNTSSEEVLTIATPALQSVTIGDSVATQEAQAAAAQAAAAAAARLAQLAAEKAKATTIKLAAAQVAAPDVQAVQQIILAAAAKYGLSAYMTHIMMSIAQCESGFNPHSYNPSGATGLFQFMRGTYDNSPPGREGRSIWDAQANAEAAAYKLANGAISAWNASRSCWGN